MKTKMSLTLLLAAALLTLNGCAGAPSPQKTEGRKAAIANDVDLQTEEVGDTYAVISWTTKTPMGSRVKIDEVETNGTSFSPEQKTLTTQHRARIEGLKPGRSYRIQPVGIGTNGKAVMLNSFNTITTSP